MDIRQVVRIHVEKATLLQRQAIGEYAGMDSEQGQVFEDEAVNALKVAEEMAKLYFPGLTMEQILDPAV